MIHIFLMHQLATNEQKNATQSFVQALLRNF